MLIKNFCMNFHRNNYLSNELRRIAWWSTGINYSYLTYIASWQFTHSNWCHYTSRSEYLIPTYSICSASLHPRVDKNLASLTGIVVLVWHYNLTKELCHLLIIWQWLTFWAILYIAPTCYKLIRLINKLIANSNRTAVNHESAYRSLHHLMPISSWSPTLGLTTR